MEDGEGFEHCGAIGEGGERRRVYYICSLLRGERGGGRSKIEGRWRGGAARDVFGV